MTDEVKEEKENRESVGYLKGLDSREKTVSRGLDWPNSQIFLRNQGWNKTERMSVLNSWEEGTCMYVFDTC